VELTLRSFICILAAYGGVSSIILLKLVYVSIAPTVL
jgi:hypothetical protein